MKNDILIMNVIASILILLSALCYFILKTNKLASGSKPINIVVNEKGYRPGLIQVKAGTEIKLRIVRSSVDACRTSVEFPQLNAAYPFMLDIPINITLKPQAPGMIDFNCQGSSARGRIIVI